MTETAVKESESTTADWKASLPEELRGNEALASFKDPGELVKDYLSVREKAAAATQPVVPDTPDGYKYEPPKIEGVKDLTPEMQADLKGLMALAHKNKLSNEQAQGLVNWYAEELQSSMKTAQGEVEKLLDPLKKEWGTKYEDNLAEATLAVQKIGGEKLLDALKRGGSHIEPEVIKAFHKLYSMFSEEGAGKGERHPSSPLYANEQELAARLYPSS
jgi:hypothetical protein